ncbi:Bug family tripartite tricarboxylate transporter substrate binding protein [Microvirga sp. CF3016]|uniref:Bug family tripartite tricarboxylate transporter substrate binding protein n=1 Tax=Microvirga sp. CF3016 TaxID=3110181 RepID=UPI002E786362|nr:tripartite tricarboxylate transporter substrate-binding protein [Microvirga sp. CF3016]MEE1611917.1 tripartite tricarboxylate transporter substrate-binding protein [Microvirga sp. CF3016]
MSKWKITLSAAAFLTLGSIQAFAQQNFPSRYITMIVPFAAGGPTDIVGRIVAEHMSRTLGQQVVIENVAGVAGTLGAGRVAKAEPDGHTILVGPMSTMSFSPALYPKLAFNPLTDFEPIGIAASAPIMLVTNNSIPVTKLSEFAEYMKANAGKLTNGNAGVGSTSHLACLLLNNRVGASVTLVPYRGTGPALQDVVSGQVGYLCDQVTSLMSQVQAKTVRPLAVLAPTRSPVLPDVPTASEAGMSGIDMVVWNALFAPKGTPPEIVEKLNAALIKAITDPASREKFLQLGAEPPPENQRSPQALRQVHAADVAKWGDVIRGANITVE